MVTATMRVLLDTGVVLVAAAVNDVWIFLLVLVVVVTRDVPLLVVRGVVALAVNASSLLAVVVAVAAVGMGAEARAGAEVTWFVLELLAMAVLAGRRAGIEAEFAIELV